MGKKKITGERYINKSMQDSFNTFAKTDKGERNSCPHFFILDSNFFIIADGDQSKETGQTASRVACEQTFQSFLKHISQKKSPIQAVCGALQETHKELKNTTMKASVCLVYISDNTAFTARVGDISIYLIRDGKQVSLKEESSKRREKNKLETLSPFSNIPTEFLGIGNPVIKTCRTRLRKGDIFILATAKFSSNITSEEITQTLSGMEDNGEKAEKICHELTAQARDKGSKDDITIGVVTITNSAPTKKGKKNFFVIPIVLIILLAAITAVVNYSMQLPPFKLPSAVEPSITPVEGTRPLEVKQVEPLDFTDFLNRWKEAWESMDIERYSAFYSPDFMSSGMDKDEWLARKERLNSRKEWITVALNEIITEEESGSARITFLQDYNSSDYNSVSRKTLVIEHKDGEWLITAEE